MFKNYSMKNTAIILAAGKGNRYGKGILKQFDFLEEKRVIEYPLETFYKHSLIHELIIVIPATNSNYKQYYNIINQAIQKKYSSKKIQIITGGKERYDSTWKAIQHCSKEQEDQFVLVHDAARPFVTATNITNCIQQLQKYNVVSLGIDIVDTVLQINKNIVKKIPNRLELKKAQTPQGFRLVTLEKAYSKFMQLKDKVATDDCSVILKTLPDEKICYVLGNWYNIKITYSYDIELAKIILKKWKDKQL